jgi:hypothetical protein
MVRRDVMIPAGASARKPTGAIFEPAMHTIGTIVFLLLFYDISTFAAGEAKSSVMIVGTFPRSGE